MSSPIDPHLAELMQLYDDDALNASQAEELNTILRGDAAMREAFVGYCVHTQLLREMLCVEKIAEAKPSHGSSSSVAERPSRRKHSLAAIASLAACMLLALGLWQLWPGDAGPPIVEAPVEPQHPGVQLAADWRITPTGNADFQVVEPTLVRLRRGELLIESTEEKNESGTRDDAEASLCIKTPNGDAVATGTRFYIGNHHPAQKGNSTMLKSLTRVLVLSGAVTLTTAAGSIEGTSGDLLAAEPGKPPTKEVVQANSDFAFDLYQQLAKENAGKNLFFSPYSVSTALAMTAEGARGETAEQMGQVLRFPDVARRMGDDAQLIPWETSLIHTGMADRNRTLTRVRRRHARPRIGTGHVPQLLGHEHSPNRSASWRHGLTSTS